MGGGAGRRSYVTLGEISPEGYDEEEPLTKYVPNKV